MKVMNTDHDGDGNNMSSNNDVIWRVRYRKVLKLIVAYKTFSIVALSHCGTVPGNIA